MIQKFYGKHFVLAAVVLILLSAGIIFYFIHDSHSDLNKRFPPLNLDAQRWRSATLTLSHLVALKPNAALGISETALQHAIVQLFKKDEERLHIFNPRISLDNGVIALSAEYRGPLGPDKFNITVDAALKGYVATAIHGDFLVILPTIESAMINRIESGQTVSPPQLTELVDAFINALKDRISGYLTNNPRSKIHIRPPLIKPDLAQEILKDKKNVLASAGDIKVEMRIGNSVILIGKNEVRVLLEILPHSLVSRGGTKEDSKSDGQESEPTSTVDTDVPIRHDISSDETNATVKKATEAFERAEALLYDRRPRGNAWLTFSKQLLYRALNIGMENVKVCMTRVEPKRNYSVSAAPRIYEQPSFDCMMTNDCTPSRKCEQPGCPPNRSQRECMSEVRICTPSWLGNSCAVSRHEDPVCIATRNAENLVLMNQQLACEAGQLAAKGTCETINFTERGLCETTKAAANFACTTWKGAQDIVSKLSKVGDISGSVDVDARVNACMDSFHIDESAHTLTGNMSLDGSGHLSASISFQAGPVGPLFCHPLWSAALNADMSLLKTPLGINGTLQFNNKEEEGRKELVGELAIESRDVSVDFNPPLVKALFEQNPHLLIQCLPIVQGLGIVTAGKALRGEDLDKDLKKRLDISTGKQNIRFTVPDTTLRLPSASMTLKPKEEGLNIVFSGDQWEDTPRDIAMEDEQWILDSVVVRRVDRKDPSDTPRVTGTIGGVPVTPTQQDHVRFLSDRIPALLKGTENRRQIAIPAVMPTLIQAGIQAGSTPTKTEIHKPDGTEGCATIHAIILRGKGPLREHKFIGCGDISTRLVKELALQPEERASLLASATTQVVIEIEGK